MMRERERERRERERQRERLTGRSGGGRQDDDVEADEK
jgi:hypothetical protein